MKYQFLNDYLESLPFLKELSYLELVFFINISMKYSILEENFNAKFQFDEILEELFEKIETEDKELYNFIRDYYENAFENDPDGVNEFLSNLLAKVKFLSQSFNQKTFIIINDETKINIRK